MNKMYRWKAVCGFVLAALFTSGLLAAPPAVENFCILHISDLHIDPLTRTAKMPTGEEGARSTAAIAWICKEAQQPQKLDSLGITTPPPAFVIATGDVTEYGVIDRTWQHLESLFKPMGIPFYVTPGNHDNTWTAMTAILRKRYGGDHYSFDKFGCHFVCVDSAGIQEPLPCLEARTLHWLREDLARVPKDRPVFIFQHHPLSTTEFSTPFEQLRFLEVLREHNVVLLLMGHGHGVSKQRWNTVDSVMGGSTFGPNTGYSIISVMDGVLRVVYRYQDEKKPMQKVLEKPIARPEYPGIELLRPKAGWVSSGTAVPVIVRLDGEASQVKMTADIDASKENQGPLQLRDRVYSGMIPTRGLLPGRHFVQVKAEGLPGESNRAVEFIYQPSGAKAYLPIAELTAGMKAGPLVVDSGCIVATTDGRVIHVPTSEVSLAKGAVGARPAKKPALRTLCDTKVEIIHSPALVDGTLYFSAAEEGVFSIGLDGKLNWKRPVGAVVYGTPAIMGDAVYVGDMQGFVHSIDRKTGKLNWSKPHALFSIEMPLVAKDGVLYFGAWDGFLYAVNAADGSLKWKQPGPTRKSRYHAPADCSPVIVGDTLFVTDRGYLLGAYTLDGKYKGDIANNIAAIGPTADGKGFYARGLSNGITRYNAEGKAVWTQKVAMGRFPCPPVEAAGRVYACSNKGVLNALDAATGEVLWQYQVAPQLHVMAPVAADAEGNVYVAGMDGTVTVVRN